MPSSARVSHALPLSGQFANIVLSEQLRTAAHRVSICNLCAPRMFKAGLMSDTHPTNTSTIRSQRPKESHFLRIGAGIAGILFLAAFVAPYFLKVDGYRPNIV